MNLQTAVDMTHEAMRMALVLTLPVLLASLLVGVIISLLQAVTQINEMTLSFIPKLIGMALVALLTGPWMLRVLVQFTHQLIVGLPAAIR